MKKKEKHALVERKGSPQVENSQHKRQTEKNPHERSLQVFV